MVVTEAAKKRKETPSSSSSDVICIDLTESDEESPPLPSSSRGSSLPKTSQTPADLTSTSSRGIRSSLKHKSRLKKPAKVTSISDRALKRLKVQQEARTSAAGSCPHSTIVLDDDDDVEMDRKPAARTTKTSPVLEDDGFQIMDAPQVPMVPLNTPTSAATGAARVTPVPASASKPGLASGPLPQPDTNDDVEIVGAKNELKLPHMRQHCTACPFDKTGFNLTGTYPLKTIQTNALTCDLCYCYVCDCPVKDCKSWSSKLEATTGNTLFSRDSNHCCATEDLPFWKSRRLLAKGQTTTTVARRYHDYSEDEDEEEEEDSFWHHFGASMRFGYGRYDSDEDDSESGNGSFYDPGPFAPESEIVQNDPSLIRCRRCGWYLRKGNRVCNNCGIMPAEICKFKRDENHWHLGQREISFQILSLARKAVGSDSTPSDEAEIDQDTFEHLLCVSPSSDAIVELLLAGAAADRDKASDPTFRAGIIVDSESDRCMLRHLFCFRGSYNIACTWDKEARKGVSIEMGPVADVDLCNQSLIIWISLDCRRSKLTCT